MTPDFRYLSLGAGVQSTALLVLAQDGRFGPVDVAIFADTGDEPQWVYDHLRTLEEWSSIPIARVSHGHLSADVIARHRGEKPRFAAIPAFTMGADGRPTPLRRQCTREYKITPIEREVRRRMGFRKGERIKGRAAAEALIGISTDEAVRMKDSRTPWSSNRYPLIELGLSRRACLTVVAEAGLPEPQKSSCVFCPYHSDAFWTNLRDHYPEEFGRAVEIDAAIRNMSRSGVAQPVYLHRSLVPLSEVKFRPKPEQQTLDMFQNECEGMCGV